MFFCFRLFKIKIKKQIELNVTKFNFSSCNFVGDWTRKNPLNMDEDNVQD